MTRVPKQHEIPELLTFIADCTAHTLRECIEIDAETADHIGYEVMLQIAEKMEKQTVYVPSLENFMKHDRDVQIWRKCNGNNYQELAREYKISTQWVYRIMKKMNAIKLKEMHPSLFDDEGS